MSPGWRAPPAGPKRSSQPPTHLPPYPPTHPPLSTPNPNPVDFPPRVFFWLNCNITKCPVQAYGDLALRARQARVECHEDCTRHSLKMAAHVEAKCEAELHQRGPIFIIGIVVGIVLRPWLASLWVYLSTPATAEDDLVVITWLDQHGPTPLQAWCFTSVLVVALGCMWCYWPDILAALSTRFAAFTTYYGL